MKLFILALMINATAFAATKTIVTKESEVEFSINKFKIGKMIEGEFKDFSGTLDYDEKKKLLNSVKAEIKISSIDTESEKRDGHLKSPDFFNAEKFPVMTFVSTEKTKLKKGKKIKGNLTLKGVTKEVALKITKVEKEENGLEIEAETVIDRYDYGITWNSRMDSDKEESIADKIANATKGLINKYVIDNKVNVKIDLKVK